MMNSGLETPAEKHKVKVAAEENDSMQTRIRFAISNWRNGPRTETQSAGDRMASLLQELVMHDR